MSDGQFQVKRHSREGGNPASLERTSLGPRLRGDDVSVAAIVTQLRKAQSYCRTGDFEH